MSRIWFLAGIGLAILVASGSPARGQEKEKELVDRVREAIDQGVQYLRGRQDQNGHWEVEGLAGGINKGGLTSLAMLALLNSGIKADDPLIERGLAWLRKLPPKQTYVVGLQTMVLAAAGQSKDREQIQRNVDWLIKNRVFVEGQFAGWSYGDAGLAPVAGINASDNSNTQYALLGLHEAQLVGAKIDKAVWRAIRDFYIKTQRAEDRTEGGWGYAPLPGNGSLLTMTSAGLCGLLIAGTELNDSRETFLPNGTAKNCGRYQENNNVIAAVNWIGHNFRLRYPQAVYYNIYGLERVGRLTGQRFLGNHDWYREGCQFLIDNKVDDLQNNTVYWVSGGHDLNSKIVCTSFALLFLSKGRTPILISKLTHGPGNDWNNDHNDARNLADYAGKELFKHQPMAWQIFDAKRGITDNTRDEILTLVGDLLQSPIAYFNGHRAPVFSEAEEELLKEYVEQGGFIFAEACCGREEFDHGFRELMKRLFPDTPLEPLKAEHPIWRAHALVKPGEFPLEGIERGCKTVVVYSPKDLSCLWESNQLNNDRVRLGFRLGGNIIAYATGMEPPKPRLTPTQVFREDGDRAKIPRGYLKVVQIRHEGDWQPAPRAMRNLMAHVQEDHHLRLPVALKTEALPPSQENILDYKFLYMHGRNTFSFAGDKRALENLRGNLNTGGLLFADACCGKQAFDKSFRELMTQLFPDKPLEKIPVNDELYGKELNGETIVTVHCRRDRLEDGGNAGYKDVPPFLEGIKINNRWVVIYSKYDIGCALEKHQSTDCLGHDYDSAVKIGTAAVLYALKR